MRSLKRARQRKAERREAARIAFINALKGDAPWQQPPAGCGTTRRRFGMVEPDPDRPVRRIPSPEGRFWGALDLMLTGRYWVEVPMRQREKEVWRDENGDRYGRWYWVPLQPVRERVGPSEGDGHA